MRKFGATTNSILTKTDVLERFTQKKQSASEVGRLFNFINVKKGQK